MSDMKHLEFIETVASHDLKQIRDKEENYQGSWKKRGGVGAFMMLARKWDRLENMLSGTYDIFRAISKFPNGEDGSILAEIRDLRTYLTLVEAEMMARGVVKSNGGFYENVGGEPNYPGTPEDGGHHADDRIERLVDRFLAWQLPESVASDECVTQTDYPHYRTGTNLLTADEARQMLEWVLETK